MSNMSYCRFENTKIDLADCQAAINDMMGEASSELKLSERELGAAQALVAMCLEIVTTLSEHIGKSLDDVTEQNLEDAMAAINEACTNDDDEDEE